MSEYLMIAENVLLKNGKVSCINIFDRISTVAMPSEFRFDLLLLCGPKWKEGEHKLQVKVRANDNDKEISIGELTVNIPNEGYVYNAYAQDLKFMLDYSVRELTFLVYEGENVVLSRTYGVTSMFVPQQKQENAEAKNDNTGEAKKEEQAEAAAQ